MSIGISRILSRKGMQVGEIIKWVVILIPLLILVFIVIALVVDVGTGGIPEAANLVMLIKCNFGII